MISGSVLLFTLILSRVAAFVAVMPLFSGQGTPRLIRVGVAMALAVFWLGTLPPVADLGPLAGGGAESWILYGMVLGREALLGALTALVFGLFLAPPRIAAELAAQQVGLAESGVLGPTGPSNGALTAIFESLGGLVFFALDGHHVVLAVLHASFARFPLGGTTLVIPTEELVDGVATTQALGVLLAGPLVLSLFLVTVILALIGRIAPQLNIFSVGFTIQAAASLIACYFLIPDLMATLATFLGQLGEMAGRLLG